MSIVEKKNKIRKHKKNSIHTTTFNETENNIKRKKRQQKINTKTKLFGCILLLKKNKKQKFKY